MKYYKLTKDLPTFEKGDIFCRADKGGLWHCTGIGGHVDIMAYAEKTLESFPNILKDWFREVPAPERDSKTKYAFMNYISDHKDERFFQAVRNFAARYLEDAVSHVYVSSKVTDTNLTSHPTLVDTFYWECDEMLKEEK